MAYFYTLAAFLFYLIQHCLATTVVVIRTPEHVVVGADSMVVNWHMADGREHFYTCKLHKQKSMLFVIQGMGIVDRWTHFSAEELAREAISSSHSLKQAAVQFVKTSSAPYARVMSDLKKYDPSGWSLVTQHHGAGIPLVVIFFGIEEGIPKYVIAGLRVTEGVNLTVSGDTASCPGPACQGFAESALVIGQSDAAYRQVAFDDRASLTSFRHARGDRRAVETIIALEEQAVPEAVGGTIRIVTIDAKGQHWVPESSACQ